MVIELTRFDKIIPENGDPVHNFSVGIKMNEDERMKSELLEMVFDYDKV